MDGSSEIELDALRLLFHVRLLPGNFHQPGTTFAPGKHFTCYLM